MKSEFFLKHIYLGAIKIYIFLFQDVLSKKSCFRLLLKKRDNKLTCQEEIYPPPPDIKWSVLSPSPFRTYFTQVKNLRTLIRPTVQS